MTEGLPFEVEIIEDENLTCGTIEEVQKGAKGSKTTIYKQKIKNGQADGEMTFEEDSSKRKEPTNRIIRLGKKAPEGTETTVNKEIPVEIEYVYDDSKDKGYVEKGDLIQAKVETKVVSKVVDGKVVNTEETVVTPAKQKIIVGTKDYTGEFEYKDTDTIPFETEVTIDPSLKPNEIVEDQAGQEGLKERVVNQSFTNGTKAKQVVGEYTITKEPVNRKIRIGAKIDGAYEYKEEIPFEVEIRKNKNLNKGEHRLIQQGLPGEKTTSLIIENSKIKGDPKSKVSKDPVKHIIEIGDEDFTGEFTDEKTYENNYKTQIIFDENLESGKIEEIQEGINSKYKYQVKQKIVNGSITEKNSNTTELEKGQDRIVKVGTKELTKEVPVEKIVEVVKEVPVEKIVEVVKEVPVEIIKEVPVEVIKEVPVEVIKEVPVEKLVEVVKEVPVEVIKEIPVEVVKEVPVEVIKEIIKEVPGKSEVVEIIKEVPVEIIKEVPVEVIKEIPVEILKDSPGIIVKHNEDLKAGEIKIVDKGEKKITRIKDGKKEVLSEGRKMIVEVGSKKIVEKCQNPTNPEEKPSGEKTDDDTKASIDKASEDNKPSDNKKPSEDEESPGKDNKIPDDSKLPQTDDKEDNPSEDRPKERPSQEDKDGEKPSEDRPKDENTPTKDNNTSDDTNNEKVDGELKLEEKNKASQRKKEIPNKRFIKKDNLSSKIKDDTNPKTGISSLSGILNALGLSALAFKKSKKKK